LIGGVYHIKFKALSSNSTTAKEKKLLREKELSLQESLYFFGKFRSTVNILKASLPLYFLSNVSDQ
jgi:hypothetical protein